MSYLPDTSVITPTQNDSTIRTNMDAPDAPGMTGNDERQVVPTIPVDEADLPVLGADGDVLSSVRVDHAVVVLTVDRAQTLMSSTNQITAEILYCRQSTNVNVLYQSNYCRNILILGITFVNSIFTPVY